MVCDQHVDEAFIAAFAFTRGLIAFDPTEQQRPTCMQTIVDPWLRRWWRPSPADEAYAGLQPMTVVTGGSQGIGRALAVEFAKLGNPVMLVARQTEPLAEAVRVIEAATRVKAFAVTADLSTPEGIAAVDAALIERKGYCDVLVNNAAMGLAGPFAAHDAADVGRLLDLNMRALTSLMHRHLPGMLVRGRGGVLNVASLAGYLPGPHQAAYYASKAYVISLTEAVAAENRGQGVRIAVLAPGPIDTAFHKRMGGDSAYYTVLAGLMGPAYVARRALRGFQWGQTVLVPGIHYRLLAVLIRATPHPVLVPITGWLLKRRD